MRVSNDSLTEVSYFVNLYIKSTLFELYRKLFIYLYGIRILNPIYTDWLLGTGEDLTQHYIGWEAFRRTPWQFPLGMVDCLAYPNKTSVILTDSIPLFAVLFKIMSPVLPDTFQYFGIWGMLCWILMGILAVRILSKYETNPVKLFFSSALFLIIPTVLHRMYAHTALAGQWILLLGLVPLFDREKYSSKCERFKFIFLLGALAASIHLYFVLMCGIELIGICVYYYRKLKSFVEVIISLLIYCCTSALIVYILGGFYGGFEAQNSGLGFYSHNIIGLFDSQGMSSIIEELPRYGVGQGEGFAYIGMGMLILFALSVPLILVLLFNREKNYDLKQITALLVVCIISFIFALSPVITLGSHLLVEIQLPHFIYNMISIFRCTGRVAWIYMYIVMICSCIVVCKLFNKRIGVIIICLAFVVQMYDLHDQMLLRHQKFMQKEKYVTTLRDDSFWPIVAANNNIKHIIFVGDFEKHVMFDVTQWALENDKTVNDFYFARSLSGEKKQQYIEETLASLTGENIYIFAEDAEKSIPDGTLDYYEVDGLLIGYK